MALKTYEDLVALVGSSAKLAAFLDLTQYTVDRWRSSGVPHVYWTRIMDEYKVSLQELHNITELARKEGLTGKRSYHGTKK